MYKKQYIYINGKVIVENGKKKEIFTPFKGFEDVLCQKNILEKLKEKKEEYEYQKNVLEQNTFKKLLSEIGCLIGINCLLSLFIIYVGGFFNPAIVVSFYSVLFLICSAKAIRKYVKEKRTLKAVNYVLPFLEEQLIKEKEKLEKLNAEEKVYKEPTQDVYLGKISSNKEKIKYIEDFENLYCNCGYDNKKYILYYQLGLLREKLKQKNATEDELDKAEQCIAADAFHEKNTPVRRLAIHTIKKFRK